MKTFYFFLFITLSYINVCAQCADTAKIFKYNYKGKKYEVVKEKKSWISAASCAIERGGYLVQIGSKSEQDSIYNAIVNKAGVSKTYTVVNDGGGIAYVWIGATDKKTEGTWLWDGNDDGTGINFWNGQGTAGSGVGSVVGGAYNNWGGSTFGTEPDDYSSNQDAAGIALAGWPYGDAGEWNDISSSNSLFYVIEYDSSFTIGLKRNSVNENEVCVYPNPTNGVSTVKFNNRVLTYDTQIGIYDLLGNEVFHSLIALNSDHLVIDFSAKPKGMYLLKVYDQSSPPLFKTVIVQ